MEKKMRFILNVQRNRVKFLCYGRLYSSSLAAKNYKLLRFSIPLFYTLFVSLMAIPSSPRAINPKSNLSKLF